MSAATAYPPLYPVPDPVQEQKHRFAALLLLRRAVRYAFDAARRFPGVTLAWVTGRIHDYLDRFGGLPAFAWLGTATEGVTRLARHIGPVPMAAAVVSTPPFWRLLTRAAGTLGRFLGRLARSAWEGTHHLLSNAGSTGERISGGLHRLADMTATAATTVMGHPATAVVTAAIARVAAIVRPTSYMVVAHRALAVLVPVPWVRAVIEFLTITLVLTPGLPGEVRDSLRQDTATGEKAASASTSSVPEATPPTSSESSQDDDPASTEEATDTTTPPNRAARRAQQQEQARARKSRR